MASPEYIHQVTKNIYGLINNKKYKEAYLKCKQYVSKFPKEEAFADLLKEVENLAKKENKKVIDEKIDQTKELWKKENYKQIIENLTPLLKLDNSNSRLKKNITKAQTAYKEQTEKQAHKFEEERREKLDKLFKENEAELEEELFFMERNNPGNKLVGKIVAEYRDRIIERKISEKSDLIYSDKYEDIDNFIHQLEKIDKSNKRIKELEDAIKKRKAGTQLNEKGEYVYKGETHLDTLMKLGRYDKAIAVAREIIEVDKNNEKVRKILKTAEKKLFKQNQSSVISQIKSGYQKLIEAFKKDKTKFTKI